MLHWLAFYFAVDVVSKILDAGRVRPLPRHIFVSLVICYICYVAVAVAERVFKKHKANSLIFEEVTLDIKHLRSPHQTKTLRDGVRVLANTLFLEVSRSNMSC